MSYDKMTVSDFNMFCMKEVAFSLKKVGNRERYISFPPRIRTCNTLIANQMDYWFS